MTMIKPLAEGVGFMLIAGVAIVPIGYVFARYTVWILGKLDRFFGRNW